MSNAIMRNWMQSATAEEQAALALNSGSSRPYLYKLARGERTASAELAGAIEQAAKGLRAKSKGRLPRLLRTDLCPACAGCPFAKRCLNGKGE